MAAGLSVFLAHFTACIYMCVHAQGYVYAHTCV